MHISQASEARAELTTSAGGSGGFGTRLGIVWGSFLSSSFTRAQHMGRKGIWPLTWKERSCLEESPMLSISTQIQACSRAPGGDLSGADTQGAASPTAPAACSSWRTWLLLPVTQGIPPTACQPSHSSHPAQLSARSCRQAPSATRSGCCV